MTSAALVVYSVADGGERVGPTAHQVQKRDEVAGAVVIDVAGAQSLAREVLQVEVLFVRCAVGTDDAEAAAARPALR